MYRYVITKGYVFVWLTLLIVLVIFFKSTIFYGKLPIPSDTLVGLYHPWRDLYAKEYPRGMPFKNFLITDPIRQQIPWRKQALTELFGGSLPFWNNFAFSGAPLLGNIQSGALYPLNVLFFFLPFPLAWTGLIILQMALGGIFFVFFAGQFRFHPLSAVMGALAWIFSGFSIAWLTWGTMMQTAMWLPLILLSIDKWREERRKIFLVLLTIGFSMSFLAGHIQIFFYVFILSAVYSAVRTFFPANESVYKESKIYLIGIGISIICFAVITSIQWWSVYHTFLQSTRSIETAQVNNEGWFLPWKHLVQLVVPDFFGNPATMNYWGVWNYGELVSYIGVIPLFMALIGVVQGGKIRFFWIFISLLALLVMLPTPIAYIPFQLKLPFISSFQPTRVIVLLCFSLAMLSMYGFEYILSEQFSRRKIFFPWAFLTAIFVSIWVIVFVSEKQLLSLIPIQFMDVVKRNLIVPTVLFFFGSVAVFASKIQILLKLLLTILLLVTVFDLLRFGWKFTPFTDIALFFPNSKTLEFLKNQKSPFRVMPLDDRILPPNVSGFYGIESVGGYDPLSTRLYETYISAMERGNPDIHTSISFNRIVTPKRYTSVLFPHLSVSYLLTLTDVVDLPLLFREGETRVYRATNDLPRAYLSSKVIFVESDQEIMNTLFDPNFSVGKDAVVTDILPIDITGQNGEVRSFTQEGSRVVMEVVTNKPEFLVVSIPYDSWWRANVNGEKTQIYRTNFMFQGVVVPKGTTIVTMNYGIHYP